MTPSFSAAKPWLFHSGLSDLSIIRQGEVAPWNAPLASDVAETAPASASWQGSTAATLSLQNPRLYSSVVATTSEPPSIAVRPLLPEVPKRLYPKNGPLSGMILTALAGAATLTVGNFFPGIAENFNVPMPEPLLDSYFISLLLMTTHKIESYLTGEYDVCPVYLTNGQAKWGKNSREAMFLSFVPTFITMSFVNYLSLRGGVWPMLMMSVWMTQGLHEIHHSAKSLAQKAYYAGTASAILFTAHIDAFMFPAWREGLGLTPGWDYAFYALQVPVFLAFYLEHKGWLKKAGLKGAER